MAEPLTTLEAWEALAAGDYHEMSASEHAAFPGFSENALLWEADEIGNVVIADFRCFAIFFLFDNQKRKLRANAIGGWEEV